MKWLDVEQGSQEWLDAHLGIPSASQFDRILTPKKLAPSAAQRKYLCELIAERILSREVVGAASSIWMERGTTLEAEAAAYYELTTDRETRRCGFALTDDGQIGASPDRLVGDDGLLEIKCPMADTHIGYLLFGPGDEYRLQMQGQLWVTGRRWVDFLSHCPGLPPVLVRIERDPAVLDALTESLPAFCKFINEAQERLADMMSTKEVAA